MSWCDYHECPEFACGCRDRKIRKLIAFDNQKTDREQLHKLMKQHEMRKRKQQQFRMLIGVLFVLLVAGLQYWGSR